MAKIQIKRGLQVAVTNLLLAEGELAVALDTGNVYVGTTTGNVWLNPPGGTADEAVRLKVAREFRASGDATSPAVAFDGTQAVQLILSLATIPGLTAGTYSKLTVDTKGRVTGGANIAVGDLPSIPTSKIIGLGSVATLDTGTTAGKVVIVGADGKLPEGLLPALAITDTFEAANEAAMLALSAQKGDVCIRTDEGKSYILVATPVATLANWKWLKTPDCKILSVNGRTGAITLTAVDVGAETLIKDVAAKITMVDADTLPLSDSQATNTTKKVTFANLKAVLKSYFDTLYNQYTHPTYTAKAVGLYKVTVDATGHTSAVTAVAKADITALGIPAQDTVYSLPTASASVIGGVKVGDGLSITSGVVSVSDIDGGTF